MRYLMGLIVLFVGVFFFSPEAMASTAEFQDMLENQQHSFTLPILDRLEELANQIITFAMRAFFLAVGLFVLYIGMRFYFASKY